MLFRSVRIRGQRCTDRSRQAVASARSTEVGGKGRKGWKVESRADRSIYREDSKTREAEGGGDDSKAERKVVGRYNSERR